MLPTSTGGVLMNSSRLMTDEAQVTPAAARRSLNEVEGMGKRAARGAGLSFGMAEEAGKAARWLMARGLPGVTLLADLLAQHDKQGYAELAPADVDGVWRAPGGRLCPLIAGAALCDRAAELAAGRVFELGKISQPLLLAPFAAGVAKLTGGAIALTWDDVTMILMPAGHAIEGNRDRLAAKATEAAVCRHVDEPAVPIGEPVAAVNELAVPVDDPTAPAWSRLEAFAQRTLAPATDASRLSGAGAGLSDNN